MARRYPSFFPQRLSSRVPAMAYVGGMEGDDTLTARWDTPLLAASNTNILNAQSVSSGTGTTTLSATYTGAENQAGRWGRGVRLVASGAYAQVITVIGRDYLGQVMRENITANGTTPVLGLKAFRYIDQVLWAGTAAVTIDLGFTNLLGFPHKFMSLINEVKNGALSANAGTFTAALATGTAATATNADVRGTYLPATVLPDGTNIFEVRYTADNQNLHGNRQFSG